MSQVKYIQVTNMRILAIGAHAGDVELGCEASLALFKKKGHDISVLVLIKGECARN
jgi:LmbE family N-acetylglucosaminyl deacetylase